MTEETEILICKAAAGALTPAETERWKALCRAEPELRAEAEAMAAFETTLRSGIEKAEEGARANAPDELPPYLVASLEAARKEVFSAAPDRPAVRPGVWRRFSAWLTEATHLPAPALAMAAAVVVAAAGWWALHDGGGGVPTLANVPPIFKDAVTSTDLPVASPGTETHFVDPPLIWISLGPEPVTVEIIDAGGTLLAMAEGRRSPMDWEAMAENKPDFRLRPGETYLVRFRRGEVVSGRVVRVRVDAMAIAEAAADPEAPATARAWLESGHAGDALALAGYLAKRAKETGFEPDSGLTALREEALATALRPDAETGQ